MHHLTLQMTILAIVPGISKVFLQENLVDCADCGGLDQLSTWGSLSRPLYIHIMVFIIILMITVINQIFDNIHIYMV